LEEQGYWQAHTAELDPNDKMEEVVEELLEKRVSNTIYLRAAVGLYIEKR